MKGLLRLASLHRYRWVAHMEKGGLYDIVSGYILHALIIPLLTGQERKSTFVDEADYRRTYDLHALPLR